MNRKVPPGPPEQERERRHKLFRVVCHDLKDPLAAIEMATSVLLRALKEQNAGERTERVARAIERSARRMDGVVLNCVDFFEIDSGILSLDMREHRIGALFAKAVARVEPEARAKGFRVACASPTPDPSLRCDGERIGRALAQLIGNAIKFGCEGGSVDVRAAESPEKIVVTVADDGPGLTPDRRANVFDPFWHASQSPREGTGLGIAIAKGVIDAHGGTMVLEDASERGTRWSLTLPRTLDG